jgi:hypothetical protein
LAYTKLLFCAREFCSRARQGARAWAIAQVLRAASARGSDRLLLHQWLESVRAAVPLTMNCRPESCRPADQASDQRFGL